MSTQNSLTSKPGSFCHILVCSRVFSTLQLKLCVLILPFRTSKSTICSFFGLILLKLNNFLFCLILFLLSSFKTFQNGKHLQNKSKVRFFSFFFFFFRVLKFFRLEKSSKLSQRFGFFFFFLRYSIKNTQIAAVHLQHY